VSIPQSRFLYTAREFDSETGLYHYRARAYSPALGRFLQPDPIDFSGGDINMLRYAGNNPANVVDPLGLWGLNDCWSTPFPPHDPLNIPNPKPPGTGSGGQPPKPPGERQAWRHTHRGNGGSGGGTTFVEGRGREFVTGLLTTLGGIGSMIGGAALTASTYGFAVPVGAAAMLGGATSFGLGMATMTHALTPNSQGIGTPTGSIPQGPVELAGAFTGNPAMQNAGAWGNVALSIATPPRWGGVVSVINQSQSSGMAINEP
jgi:RHS repeat-associated protein